MYSPTLWETFKNAVRYILCRHKHTKTRTIRTGSDLDNLQTLGTVEYCLDCQNNIGGITR